MEKIIVLKVGGGVLTNAEQIKKIQLVLIKHKDYKVILVISAFGKTTNLLEELAEAFFYERESTFLAKKRLNELILFHKKIIRDLFPKGDNISTEIGKIFEEIKDIGLNTRSFLQFLAFRDQITSLGEIIAVSIVSEYLRSIGVENVKANALDFMSTDRNFSKAEPDELYSPVYMKNELTNLAITSPVVLVQGFIGLTQIHSMYSLELKLRTTLGREGSDYTASLVAAATKAEKVIFYKNVPGIMDIDPKIAGGEHAKLIREMSYDRAKELVSGGTAKKVLHEKTIDVLKKAGIPAYVKDFEKFGLHGTLIH